MAITQTSREHATQVPKAATVDLKLEVVVLPVSDVDRSKRFYEGLGWRVDGDFKNGDSWRVVQMTPPGSPCSIHFGKGITTATPGSIKNLYLVVSDVEAARRELIDHGAEVAEPFHFTSIGSTPEPGIDPEHRSYLSYATFSDPDGNSFLLQEIKTRLPGRGLSNFDVGSLTALLRETEEHHGEYERTSPPKHHWSGWYAGYMVARQEGKTEEEAAKDGARNVEAARR